jgi:voltage-gated potassium channel
MSFLNSISRSTKRRLLVAPVAIAVMLVIGTLGFSTIEGRSWLDSLYLATQTVTTVGYGDVPNETAPGRAFATLFMLLGVGVVLYSLTVMAQAIVQSEVFEALNLSRKRTQMEKLSGHYIVCGAGRVGRRVIKNLQRQNEAFVVVETDQARVAEFTGVNVIIGDASSEENLIAAGVKRAKGLASCLPDDASNVYVVLTARGLNPDLHIVARAVEEQAESKLVRAGASRVIAPTIIGSQSMARALLRPAIADFMDSIVAETLDLVFEEIAVGENCPYIGKQLSETNISSGLNVIVVAIRPANGELEFHPTGDATISTGDLLIVVGKAEDVKRLIEVARK